jgi:ketosteroid isomerase-like protein
MVSIKTLEAFVEAFNKHDLDEILSFFADDCVMDLPRGPNPWGGERLGRNKFEKAVSVGSKAYRMLTTVKTITGLWETWGSPSGL